MSITLKFIAIKTTVPTSITPNKLKKMKMKEVRERLEDFKDFILDSRIVKHLKMRRFWEYRSGLGSYAQ